MAKFLLEINLGNDAMSTQEDIVTALKYVVANLEYSSEDYPAGTIPDINGNRVGYWRVEVP